MTAPGRIAVHAVAVASAALHVREAGYNRGPAVERYQANVGSEPGQPWCAAAVRSWIGEAASDLNATVPQGFPRSARCRHYANWAREGRLWIPVADAADGVATVMPGDLALFWFEVLGRIAHIGIVESVEAWGVVNIEGNTGPETKSGVTREGDGVYRKRRSWAALGRGGGFARLPW